MIIGADNVEQEPERKSRSYLRKKAEGMMVVIIENAAREYIVAKTPDKSIALSAVERPGGT